MRARYFFPLIIATCLANAGCKKDKHAAGLQCSEVKLALKAEDVQALRGQVDQLIAGLPSTIHNAENLQALVNAINGQCDFNATVSCVKCIKTLPEQSEIVVKFQEAGTTLTRTIDIIGTQNGNMRFCGVHS